jgi:hypothetical protein
MEKAGSGEKETVAYGGTEGGAAAVPGGVDRKELATDDDDVIVCSSRERTAVVLAHAKALGLPYVPFRGVNCSDAAGHEVGFASIIAMVDAGKTVGGRQWDEDSSTPFYDYIASDGSRHQRWYDDEISSAAKYELAISMRLRGVGPFEYSDLGSDTPAATQHAAKMWGALKEYVVHA